MPEHDCRAARSRRSRPDERLVLDPMRPARRRHSLFDPVGVLMCPRTTSPGCHLERGCASRSVEPAIVRDHHRAAGEVEQRLLEARSVSTSSSFVGSSSRSDPPLRRLRQVDAVALAAREVADPLLLVGAAEVGPDVLARRVASFLPSSITSWLPDISFQTVFSGSDRREPGRRTPAQRCLRPSARQCPEPPRPRSSEQRRRTPVRADHADDATQAGARRSCPR